MRRREMRLLLCGALVAFSSIGAIGASSGPDTPTGAWNVTIEFEGFPPCTAPGLMTADGGVIANACTNLESPGYGRWAKTGNRTFAVTFVGLEFALDGLQVGTYKVRAEVTVTNDATQFSGPFKAEIFDAAGNVTLSLTGTVHATRINVEAL